ncbi:MAG TPA: potassium channel family protein [Candidatus Acidoferrales bacterium]|jgi:hypothetical protein|nr:potassium channel family protein [Candidatus Acidoferrales bacterium]
MKILVAVAGFILLFITLWEAFETIILPRRVTRPVRIVRLFYRATWILWSAMNRAFRTKKMREAHLSYYGPLSLLGLFAAWALLLITAFAMLQWAAGSALNTSDGPATFRTDFYLSGTTLFTLGLGDVTPKTALARFITVCEGGTGFGFLGLMISYLPTLYGAFSQRELNISLLDARAGSPPTAGELLRRHAQFAHSEALTPYLREWELWVAQLMESHLSYPVLCYFRSQHDNQSWLAAMTTVLDVTALMIAYGEGMAKWQAQLTFAMSRHCLADLAEVLRVPPSQPGRDRLPPNELPTIRDVLLECRASANCNDAGDKKLHELREMYEPYLGGLSRRLLIEIPSWGVSQRVVENWKRTAWDKISGPANSGSTNVESSHF